MFKKTSVLAMAVCALAGLVLPASAPAFWKHGHTNQIQQDQQFFLTGFVRFETVIGGKSAGVDCQVSSRVKLTAGQTTGHLETMTPDPTSDTANCKGFGLLAMCQIHNVGPQTPNWVLHKEKWQTQFLTGEETKTLGTHDPAITLTTQNIVSQLTGTFCLATQVTVTGTKVGIVPTPTTTAEIAEMDGFSQVHIQTPTGQDTQHVTLLGVFDFVSFANKTYSL